MLREEEEESIFLRGGRIRINLRGLADEDPYMYNQRGIFSIFPFLLVMGNNIQ